MALKHQLDEVTASLKQHIDIIERLRSGPEAEATAVLLRLRSTPDVSTVLSTFRTSVSPKRLSERRPTQDVLPATDTEIELELMAYHQTVYRALAPIDVLSLDLSNLTMLSSDMLSPRTTREAFTAEQSMRSNTAEGGAIDPRLLTTETLSPLRGTSAKRSPSASGLPPPSHYCDSRLQGLDLQFWTTIPISSEIAAHAISHYLETDHGHNGWFDADLFLNDLTGRRLEHCSTFLVSSLLSLACVSRSSSFLHPFLA